jgi:hypothetical protein
MSEPNAWVQGLREFRAALDTYVSPEEITRLRAEVDRLTAERDEARRDCCAFEGILRFKKRHAKAMISHEATLRLAHEIAVERGWDCFTKEVQP